MKVHARKRKMEARQAALAAGKALAEMAGVEPRTNERDDGSPSDTSEICYCTKNFIARGIASLNFWTTCSVGLENKQLKEKN